MSCTPTSPKLCIVQECAVRTRAVMMQAVTHHTHAQHADETLFTAAGRTCTRIKGGLCSFTHAGHAVPRAALPRLCQLATYLPLARCVECRHGHPPDEDLKRKWIWVGGRWVDRR